MNVRKATGEAGRGHGQELRRGHHAQAAPALGARGRPIRNAYPPPIAPRKENADGNTVIDDKDPEYQRTLGAWLDQFFALKICRMIGSEEFGTDDLVAQISLQKADFTEREFVDLVTVANKIGTGEITAADMEAARGRLVPFESSKPADA